MATKKQLLNPRQQKYKDNLLIGMSKYNAAKAAGYSENTARTHTKQLDERIAMGDVMEQVGLTDQYLAHKLMDLLNATKVIGYLHNYKKDSKGRTEKVEPDEAVSNEFIEIPDWGARAKGLELVGKFNGKLRDKLDITKTITYTEMKRIIIEHKVQELDLGEDIPDPIKKRMGAE